MIPSDDNLRKQIRAFQGFVKYFPDATAAVALLSKIANEQHNPGEPMHWAKEKSTEELDSLMNHLIDVACKGELSRDSDGILDAVKIAWRGMANLQRVLDKYGLETAFPEAAGAREQTDADLLAEVRAQVKAEYHKASEANDAHRITGRIVE
jgi:phage tail protein X